MPNQISSEDMNNTNQFSISTDSSTDGLLEEAILLWKKNRSTLGLFPRGAFEEHARNNWIIYLLEGA